MAQIPEPSYQRDEKKLIEYYKNTFQKILSELKGITNGIEQEHATSLLNQIAYILSELDQQTRQWVEETVTQAFRDGQAGAIYSIGEAASLSEAVSLASFSMLARNTVEALINDTYTDLLAATQNTERKIKQLVRSVVSDTMRVKALEQLGRRTTRNAIVEKLTQQGLSRKITNEAWVGIVDKAGRRWNLSTYAEMVVRTKLMQAHVEGVRVETLERGVDLAVVSSHGAKDACAKYEGMVISINGQTPGYATYAELRQSGKVFHPNCKHHISPVRNLALLPHAVREKNEQKYRELGLKPPTVTAPAAPVVPKKWKNAATTKEAEKQAKKLFPHMNFDFNGAHVDTINPTMKRFTELGNEWPGVAARMRYIGTRSTGAYKYNWESNTFAHATRDGKIIGLNPAFYGNPSRLQKSIADCARTKFHPEGVTDVSSILTHEFGHQVWNYLNEEYREKSLMPVMSSRGIGLGGDLLYNWERANKATEKLSRYATTNSHEGWAEGFTALYHNSPAKRLTFVKRQKALLDFIRESSWYNKGDWRFITRREAVEDRKLNEEIQQKEAEIKATYLKKFNIKEIR